MTITANLCDNAGFFGDDRPLGSAAIVSYSPFVQACKAFPEARSLCHLCLFEAKRPIFLAKRPTLLAKHTNVWTSLGPEGGNIIALAIDPATPTTLYAGTGAGGVFKSTTGGSSWTWDDPVLEMTLLMSCWA